jgi:hypothetical protein
MIMNRYSFTQRIVASILLLSHFVMSCSNPSNTKVDQNQLDNQISATLLINSANSSEEEIVTLVPSIEEDILVAQDEENGYQAVSRELQKPDDKKSNDQEHKPVHATSLGQANPRKSKHPTTPGVDLSTRSINNNNKELGEQEIVSPLSVQSSYQVSSHEQPPDLSEESNQGIIAETQVDEVVQSDQGQVQQVNNQARSIQLLQRLNLAVNGAWANPQEAVDAVLAVVICMGLGVFLFNYYINEMSFGEAFSHGPLFASLLRIGGILVAVSRTINFVQVTQGGGTIPRQFLAAGLVRILSTLGDLVLDRVKVVADFLGFINWLDRQNWNWQVHNHIAPGQVSTTSTRQASVTDTSIQVSSGQTALARTNRVDTGEDADEELDKLEEAADLLEEVKEEANSTISSSATADNLSGSEISTKPSQELPKQAKEKTE